MKYTVNTHFWIFWASKSDKLILDDFEEYLQSVRSDFYCEFRSGFKGSTPDCQLFLYVQFLYLSINSSAVQFVNKCINSQQHSLIWYSFIIKVVNTLWTRSGTYSRSGIHDYFENFTTPATFSLFQFVGVVSTKITPVIF